MNACILSLSTTRVARSRACFLAAYSFVAIDNTLQSPGALCSQSINQSPSCPLTSTTLTILQQEAELPTTRADQEIANALHLGLQGASSIEDKSIPTFSRGELPHFAGINTFLKAPYVEDVRDVGKYDATVFGVPFDGGCTYRSGTRFGPQGIRRISALYTPYNYERGIDLREQMTLCDAGDV